MYCELKVHPRIGKYTVYLGQYLNKSYIKLTSGKTKNKMLGE